MIAEHLNPGQQRMTRAGALTTLSTGIAQNLQPHTSTDAAGRPVLNTDPLGFNTQSAYNAIDQITTITDANAGVTQFNYDTKRNLASVVNPLSNTIEAYQYDNLNRITQRTDAKLKNTAYQYDGAGNVTQMTDRKGQVTGINYDAQNRITSIVFPGGVTQTRTYDTVGRLAEIREPDNATTYGYDTVDRLVMAATDSAAGHHEIDYAYDSLDRVVNRTVDGADATTYAYDNASRINSIAYRGQTTIYNWDTSNRLTTKTLPDGIQQNFQYDDADQITQIQYMKPDATVIETIAYTYDANGNRLSKLSGASSIQETGITATYDAANRLSKLTLTATNQSFVLGYDDNGNLTTKTDLANPANLTIYAWDSRNRLSSITGPGGTATFQYDALSSRISKTVNGQTIGYVYDGMQAIGETAGSGISDTLLTGLVIDEVIARYSQSGNRTYLTDALGSAVALAKDDQSIQAFYTYTPYGEAQTLGVDEGNPIQYTARENDQTGLYFYRARYYDPVLKRFINEDPIGLHGGLHTYAYVNGNPIAFTDPLGMLSGAWHQDITRNVAYSECPKLVNRLPRMVYDVDFEPGSQDPDQAFKHAMSDGPAGQSARDAALQTDRYIESQLATCTPKGLANALHAGQDKFPKGHRGKPWYGGHPSFGHIADDTFGAAGGAVGQATEETRRLIRRFKAMCPCVCD